LESVNGREDIIPKLDQIREQAQETAEAIHTMFDAIFDGCDEVRDATKDNVQVQAILTRVYEAGSIQDVLRQRLEKIVRITNRIEDPSLPDDDALLSGPQSQGDGMAQDDINRLMGDAD
jgi:hypothetical protein